MWYDQSRARFVKLSMQNGSHLRTRLRKAAVDLPYHPTCKVESWETLGLDKILELYTQSDSGNSTKRKQIHLSQWIQNESLQTYTPLPHKRIPTGSNLQYSNLPVSTMYHFDHLQSLLYKVSVRSVTVTGQPTVWKVVVTRTVFRLNF